MTYTCFNALVIAFTCLYSNTISNTNLGTNAALGMDAMNFFVIIGYTLSQRIDEQNIDRWEFARDEFWYLLGLGLVCIFGSQGPLEWWMGFVIIIYFLIYLLFRKSDSGLKETIYRALGLIRDDDVFNVSNNFRMPRRRNSISDVITPEYISTDDIALKKKIRRAESMIKMCVAPGSKINEENVRHWIKWYSMTVMIVHGSKKRIEKQKRDRAEKYREELANARRRNLVKEERSELGDETSRQIIDTENGTDQTKNNLELDGSRQFDEGPDQNDEKSQFIDEREEEEAKENAPETKPIQIEDEQQTDQEKDSAGVLKGANAQFEVEMQVNPGSSNSVNANADRAGQSDPEIIKDAVAPSQDLHDSNEDATDNNSPRHVNEQLPKNQTIFYEDDDDDDDKDYNLEFPKGFWNRAFYIIFLPINLVTYLLIPSFKSQGRRHKVQLALIVTLIVLGGISFLIYWWFEKIAIGTGATSEMLGSCFASIGFSLPFVIYNVRLYKERGEEHTFYTSFRQIGIFRIGICVGVSWMVGGIVSSSTSEPVNMGFGGNSVSYYILAGLMLICMIAVVIKKCKIPSQYGYLFYLFYIAWWASSFVLCQFYPTLGSD